MVSLHPIRRVTMSKVTDRQVLRLRALLRQGKPLKAAALRSDMDEKTGRKYRDLGQLPSELENWPRAWRTRKDPFADIWKEVIFAQTHEPGRLGASDFTH